MIRNDIEQERAIIQGQGFRLELVFKPGWKPGKLSESEIVLIDAYSGKILAEIQVEEKRIIAEERRAAKEVTAHKPEQEIAE